MQYQSILREQFYAYLRDRLAIDSKEKSVKAKQDVLESRLKRLKEDAMHRIELIEGFRETLEQLEWSQRVKQHESEERKAMHQEFLDKLH